MFYDGCIIIHSIQLILYFVLFCLEETIKKLEEKLAAFAKKHKKEIQEDPAFRKKFLEMCAPLGVDPLSSQKGFWDAL